MIIEQLRTLWDDHAKAVYAYLLHLTRNEADASDFLQDLFSRLAHQPELLDKLAQEPRGYLLRLARNAVVDQVRRHQARDRVFEKMSALRPPEFAEAEDPDHPLLRQALAEALAELPAEQRDVVHARLWKKQTLDSISVELGISINTAASRYRYGLDKMRERLRSLYEDLVPRAVPNPIPSMNQKSRNPFRRFENEEPLIQPLEARRVPSATGAGFALPILPAPEEHSGGEHPGDDPGEDSGNHLEEHPDAPFDRGSPDEIQPLFAAHEWNDDPHFDDAELAAYLDFDTSHVNLPITFDQLIKNMDTGMGGPASGAADLRWIVEKINTEALAVSGASVLTNLPTEGPAAVDSVIPGTGNSTVVLSGNSGFLFDPINLNMPGASAGNLTSAVVNQDGVLTVIVTNGANGNHDGEALVETSLKGATENAPAQESGQESPEETAPEASRDLPEQAARFQGEAEVVQNVRETVAAPVTNSPVVPNDLGPRIGVQTPELEEFGTAGQRTEDVRPEPSYSPFQPPTLPDVAAPVSVPAGSVADHEIIAIDFGTLHASVEPGNDEAAFDGSAVNQWVPVQDDGSVELPTDEMLFGTPPEPGGLPAASQPLDTVEAAVRAPLPLRGEGIAMAVTGSVLLTGETKNRKQEERK